MGLDMYLYKKTYVWTNKRKTLKIEGIDGINPERVSYIVEEVGYWRKANAIHNWFVQNVQGGVDDCKEYYVETQDLKNLLEVVCEVIRHGKKAPEKLPSQSGFFFGSTDYDQYYFDDLKRTKEILQTILKEEAGSDYYYNSSW